MDENGRRKYCAYLPDNGYVYLMKYPTDEQSVTNLDVMSACTYLNHVIDWQVGDRLLRAFGANVDPLWRDPLQCLPQPGSFKAYVRVANLIANIAEDRERADAIGRAYDAGGRDRHGGRSRAT